MGRTQRSPRFRGARPQSWAVGTEDEGRIVIHSADKAEFHRRFPNVPLGPGEGQILRLPTGLTMLVLRYRTGAEFSHGVVQEKFAKQYPNLKITNTQDLPLPANHQETANSTLTAGATSFTFQENGRAMEGFVYSSTRMMPLPNPTMGGTWFCAQLLIGTYPQGENKGAKALQILDHMANSMANDPQWFQRQYNISRATPVSTTRSPPATTTTGRIR